MEIVIGWFVFSVIAGAIASEKGRSGFGFLLLSLILSPLVGIIWAFGVSKNTNRIEQQQIKDGSRRRCHTCDEAVRVEAIKCRHCGSELAEITNDAGTGWNHWLGFKSS